MLHLTKEDQEIYNRMYDFWSKARNTAAANGDHARAKHCRQQITNLYNEFAARQLAEPMLEEQNLSIKCPHCSQEIILEIK